MKNLDIVDLTLKSWRETDFKWGERDCLISIADYLFQKDGFDRAKKYRNHYSDEKSAAKLIEKEGGIFTLIDQNKLSRVEEGLRGDIALIKWNQELIAGICTGSAIAFRIPRGMIEIEKRFLNILQFWR